MKLSIIVPVYNVAQYLPKCLDSLLNQDIDKEDYEIIVVNDGSSDNSSEIAQDYANQHSNITLINQENQGLSGARNTGIRVAKGKFIQFVDSDDYLEPNVEKALVEKMEKENLDILRFNYQNVNEKYEVFEPNKSGKPFVDYTDNICDGITFLNERLGYACYVVQFILKTDLVKSQPLFKEGIYYEDVEWTPRVLVEAKRVTSVDTMVYDYLVREGSITKGKGVEKKRKSFEDRCLIIQSLQNQMIGKSDQRWFLGMVSSMVISLMGSIIANFYKEKDYYLKRIYELNVFPISDYHLNKKAVRKMRIINMSPYFYCFLMKRLKS